MYNLDEKWSRSALRDPLKYDGGTSGADECPGNLAAADCAATVNRLIAAGHDAQAQFDSGAHSQTDSSAGQKHSVW
jgi:hypothetical protein